MGYELVYEGEIESVEGTESGNWRVRVNLKPWCPKCRLAAYECIHLPAHSGGIMYFTLSEKPQGRYLRYYAEREPTPKGPAFTVEISTSTGYSESRKAVYQIRPTMPNSADA
jgi:hypothetical protein